MTKIVTEQEGGNATDSIRRMIDQRLRNRAADESAAVATVEHIDEDAICAFVDMDDNTRKHGGLFPPDFILVPQAKYLSAEHLAYAYHAVAQRFVFVFSRRSRPLLFSTTLLVALPAIVATMHFFSDGYSLLSYGLVAHLLMRFSFEALLLIVVWFMTFKILKYVFDTSLLLNGWYLASDIWMTEWDETTDNPAKRVYVNLRNQTAKLDRS